MCRNNVGTLACHYLCYFLGRLPAQLKTFCSMCSFGVPRKVSNLELLKERNEEGKKQKTLFIVIKMLETFLEKVAFLPPLNLERKQ